MFQGEHSAILLTFIKLPCVIKIFVLSIFEWTLNSLVENQNDLELAFTVFFFVDSCCVGIVLDESN